MFFERINQHSNNSKRNKNLNYSKLLNATLCNTSYQDYIFKILKLFFYV